MKKDIEKIIKSSELYYLSSNHFDDESLKLMIDHLSDKIEQLFFEKQRKFKKDILDEIILCETKELYYQNLLEQHPNNIDYQKEKYGCSCRIFQLKKIYKKI